MANIGGVILCGGQSSRMGRSKAWLPLGDECLLQRVVRIVASVVDPVVVVAAVGQDLPPLPEGATIVRDHHDALGPLAGLAAGLAALDGRAEAVYLSSCDVPFLNADFIRAVIGELGAYAIAVLRIGDYPHPLAGVYRLSVRPAVEAMLAEGRLRLRDLFESVPTRFLGADAFRDLESLININTPDEYAAALQIFHGSSMHPHKPHFDRHAGSTENVAFMKRISKQKIDPPAIVPGMDAADLIDSAFLSYNGGRLREGCQLYAQRMLAPDCTVGLALSGALTPAGLGMSCLVPLVEAGFIDWIVSTGANLYHDTHYALGMDLYQAGPNLPDLELRENQVIRIYDIIFDYENLLGTDKFYRTLCRGEAFQSTFGTAEFHGLVGKYLAEREEQTGIKGKSLLASAYRCGVPIFTSSPGDSSIGMNLAALMLEGNMLRIDPLRDVNQSASIVWDAKADGGTSGVFILGGGSPKNFMLQTEPQIQEVLGLAESGHDYFLQFTDARPDTGGLSGATPSEAMTWGKVDPDKLPGTVTCYVDSTLSLPLITAYALSRTKPRPHKRYLDKLPALTAKLEARYAEIRKERGE